jgi:hypothetical protein
MPPGQEGSGGVGLKGLLRKAIGSLAIRAL